ncbi:unnamed protein product [marine sediment metagenome]|uniref:Tetratricopeptide repeat protein n=1 Tax=marine sediment metagenome TaxID=412755 RepID=X0YI74_9ZZZZ
MTIENPEFRELEKQANVFIETARIFAKSNKMEESIKNYQMALKIFEKIGYSFQVRKIKWEIEKLKAAPVSPKDNSELIRKDAAEKIKAIASRKRVSGIQNNSFAPKNGPSISNRSSVSSEKIEKLKQFEAAKKERENKLNEANSLLDLAQKSVKNNKFEQAKENYLKAADKFEELGWGAQAATIRKEIDVLQEKADLLQTKIKFQEEKERKKQKEYEDRIKKDQEEQDMIRKEKEEEARRRNPQQQRKYELALFNIKKAEEEVAKGKFKKASNRFRYALDIFLELQSNPDEIEELKLKISKLKQ